jgi:hypothetical protein
MAERDAKAVQKLTNDPTVKKNMHYYHVHEKF